MRSHAARHIADVARLRTAEQPHELQGQQSKRENGRQQNGSIDDVKLSGLVARGSFYVLINFTGTIFEVNSLRLPIYGGGLNGMGAVV
ncbi:hypothetical protein EJB05_21967, partial [Eragrostis curvula]